MKKFRLILISLSFILATAGAFAEKKGITYVVTYNYWGIIKVLSPTAFDLTYCTGTNPICALEFRDLELQVTYINGPYSGQ